LRKAIKKKPARDMKDLIDLLRADPKFRGVNCDKLQLILEQSELHVPARWPRRFDVTKIREYAAAPPVPSRAPLRGAYRYARWALVPACAAALFFLVWPWMSRDDGRAGTITRVTGTSMTVSRAGRERLDAGDTLSPGDVITTGRGASIDISFNDTIRMRVLEGSRIELGSYELAPARRFDALVSAGGCILQADKLSAGESVALHTAGTEASVKGTAFAVTVSADGSVRYEVYEGTVRVRRRLPSDSGLGPEKAEKLARYFESHELMLDRGTACSISPDAVSPERANPDASGGRIAGLSLPVMLKGAKALTLKDEALSFAGIAAISEGAGDRGAAVSPDTAGRTGSIKRSAAEHEPSIMGGQKYLLFIPENDSILTIDQSYIDASRGGVSLWRLDLEDAIASMPVRDGLSLYFSTVRGTVSRLDLGTGSVAWTALAGGTARLVLDGSGIYYAASQGLVGKLDRRGELQWKSSVGDEISAAPVLSRHMVLVPTRKGRLVGIDKYRGLNAFDAGFPGSIVSLGTKGDTAFVATENGQLSAFSMKEGSVAWRYPLNDVFADDMIIQNDSVYVFGRGGRVHRVSMSGEQIWTRDAGNPIVKRVAEDATRIYLPSEQTLCVINKITGDITWSLMVPGIKSGNVAVSGGNIYFENEKNGLTSLKK